MGVFEIAVGCGSISVILVISGLSFNTTQADKVLFSCNGSVGLIGKPPRPVAVKVFSDWRVPGVQALEIWLEASARLIGSSIKPRLGSLSIAGISILPLKSGVAPLTVISLVLGEGSSLA
jgi:hypothetical protein